MDSKAPSIVSAYDRKESKAAARQSGQSIGAILIDSGKLTLVDAEKVLQLQRERKLRFGEAAVELGLVDEDDIRHALSRQFDYAYLAPGQGGMGNDLVAAYQPFSDEVETLRRLRSQLLLRWFNAEVEQKAIAIVSPGRGEGRSVIAANLAIVFSQLGEKTLLIDADMRHPRQHELFNVDNKVGLSALLSGRGETEAVKSVPALPDLAVIPAGSTPPNPQELLGRPAFDELLAWYAQDCEFIILDTPAAAHYADADTAAARAGAALIVARRNMTGLDPLRAVAANLASSNTRVVGTVLIDF